MAAPSPLLLWRRPCSDYKATEDDVAALQLEDQGQRGRQRLRYFCCGHSRPSLLERLLSRYLAVAAADSSSQLWMWHMLQWKMVADC
jgi:hypothetical protein